MNIRKKMKGEDIVQEFKEEMKIIAKRREKSRHARKGNVVLSLRKGRNYGFWGSNKEWEVMLWVDSGVPGLGSDVKEKFFGDDYEKAEEYYKKLVKKHGFEEEASEE